MISRLRPNLKVTRILTGRLATGGFPLLGLPKRSAEGKRIRSLVRAPEGFVIYRIDYSQIELRIAAHLSQDPRLMQVFREAKVDIHTLTGHLALGEPLDKAKQSDAKRVAAKAVNFGYWMGLEAKGLTEQIHKEGNLAWSANCPGCRSFRAEHRHDCDSVRLFAKFDQVYPGARRYQQDRRDHAVKTGYAYGMWGESWYLPGVWSPHEEVAEGSKRQAFALPIQSGNARLIKQAMARLESTDLPWAGAQGGRVEPLLQVHDELLFCVETTFVRAWHARIKSTMEGIAQISVPIVAEGSYGPSWMEQEGL